VTRLEVGEVSPLTEFQRALEPGRLYVKRPKEALPASTEGRKLRLLSWNIGRGYQPERIAETILALQPDIACLQEVDWNNQRTGSRDVLQILAERTGMFGVWGIEFLELHAPARARRLAGGGATGNAVLSRTLPSASFRIELPSAVDWQHDAMNGRLPRKVRRRLCGEPRIGARFCIAAEFPFAGTRLVVCSVHFEDKFGGASARFRQFHSVVGAIAARGVEDGAAIVVAGDFNTFDSQIARLVVPDTDATALGRPKGVTEAEWWKRALLPPTGFADPFAADDWTFRAGPLFRAKLDWIAVKNAAARECAIGPPSSSDHRPIWVDLEVPLPSEARTSPASLSRVKARDL